MKKGGYVLCSLGLVLGMGCSPPTAYAQRTTRSSTQTYPFDIPAQPLGRALIRFGVQSKVAIAFQEDLVVGKRSKAVRATGSPAKILSRLLEGTGLAFRFSNARSVRIFLDRALPRPDHNSTVPVIMVQPDIVVTAQKRPQDMIDVPVAISVIGQRDLRQPGRDRSETYLQSVPGATYAGIIGNSSVAIRGISTSLYNNNQQGTVEVLFDDMPSLNRYYSRFNSDMRLVDVERVEVLRGPQGTLFGSGALGGAIRIINAKPDLNRFQTSGEAGLTSVRGGGMGHELKAMVNAPLVTDRLGLRFAGYDIVEPGFVDNVVRHQKDVNRVRSTGARATLAFTPTDRLTLTGWAWHQRDRTGGDFVSFLHHRDGEAYQSGSIRAEDAVHDEATLLNLTARYDMASVDLTSSTSLGLRKGRLARDYTSFWQAQVQFDGPVDDTVASRSSTFVQELRIASKGGGPLQGVAGIFFLDQQLKVNFERTMDGLAQEKGASSDLLSQLLVAPDTREFAVFGEATLRLSRQFDVTVGARWFRDNLRFTSQRTGYLAGEPTPVVHSDEGAITPKLAIAFKPTPGMSFYAQVANGYRTGQNNFVGLRDSEANSRPVSAYGPDDLWNYEFGIKFRKGRDLQINAALFYIDWRNIQLTRRQTITTYTQNAGNAVSKGAELEMTGEPVPGVRYGLSAAYVDARLTRVSEGLAIRPGDLPGAPKLSASGFLELSRGLDASRNATLRIEQRYVGARDAGLEPAVDPAAERTEAYFETTVSLSLGSSGSGVRLYVRNLFDRGAAIAIRELAATPLGAIRLTPRTIGLQFFHAF